MTDLVKLQINIVGYRGPAVSVAAVLDNDTNVLTVVKELKLRDSKADPEFTLISNTPQPQADYIFSESNMLDAIQAYFLRNSQGLLVLKDGVQRFTPDNRIEPDTINGSGRTYRISADIENGQMAIIALCHYVDTQQGHKAMIDAMDQFSHMYRVLSI